MRIRVATRESSRNECRERRGRILATSREIEADRSRCLMEISEGEERLSRLGVDIEETSLRIQELHEGREGRVSAVVECERSWSDLGLALNGAESEAREARRAASDLRERVHGEDLRRTELFGEWKLIEARLFEDYELSAGDVMEMGLDWPVSPEGTPLEASEVEQLVLELKDRIKRLGPVNLLAIEEYEEKSTRLAFLKTQYGDLTKARGELMEAISQINTTASKLFMETFDKVCVNFQKTFQVLFQGGECSLALIGDDPLEAEIEIVARPRGKKPQSIAQLSSGERALTAIALLFAIYLVKPSPFCLLDEVDAPLDDANVDRFVAMLREFSQRTQFIVITHNKKTMEAADTLYGVTMASPGVSQVVSVRLSEAEAVRDGKRVERRSLPAGNGTGNGNGSTEHEEDLEPVPRIQDPVVQ
jgi:chromosome segregation protein